MNLQDKFGADYFELRHGNDLRRQASYRQERAYILRWIGEHVFQEGRILDMGCSTGEFINALDWNMENAYGMEISEYAREFSKLKGIKFSPDIASAREFFDLVVFRGTIQYMPSPFDYIRQAYAALKPGAHILFLATPNTNSPYYFFFQTLPFLEEEVNHWIPCDTSLRMVLQNAGFKIIDLQYPYWHTPYAKLYADHWKFMKKLIFRTDDRFAFWRSSMSCLAQKPAQSAEFP